MRREERVLVLVWSLPDALPGPLGARSGVSEGPPAAGDPMVVPGPAWRPEQAPRVLEGCEWCQPLPRARWDQERETWVPLAERFDRLPQGLGERHGRLCEPCEGTGWRPVTPGPDGRRGPVEERVAYRLKGSYGELERAWAPLKPAGRFALVRAADVFPRPWEDAADVLEYVAGLMPLRIVVARDVLTAWRMRDAYRWRIGGPRRDEQIRKLVRDGESVAKVARRSGLSERRVRQIAYGS